MIAHWWRCDGSWMDMACLMGGDVVAHGWRCDGSLMSMKTIYCRGSLVEIAEMCMVFVVPGSNPAHLSQGSLYSEGSLDNTGKSQYTVEGGSFLLTQKITINN